MSYKHEYDDSGLATSYLLLSLILPCAIYFTYSLLSLKNKKRTKCSCVPCSKIKENRRIVKKLLVLFLWIIVSYLLHNVKTIKISKKGDFNPADVFGVEPGADIKDIRRQLKKLLVKYNISKAPEHLKEEYEKKRIEISKAYEILKNKNKYNKWLNTESKTGEIMAIPSILIKKSSLVILIYTIILGVFVPGYGYKKWKEIRDKNKIGIYYDSMDVFIKYMNDDLFKKSKDVTLIIRNLISLISRSREFCTYKFTSNVEEIKDKIESNFGYPLPDMKLVNEGYLVLNDYLFRTNVSNSTESIYVQKKAIRLINGLKKIAVLKNYVEIYKCLHTLQAMIIQAVFDPEYHLLQYPYVDFKKYFVVKDNLDKMSTLDALRNIMKDDQYKAATVVEKSISKLKIDEFIATVKNTGDLKEEASDAEDDLIEDVIINKEDTSSSKKSSGVVFNVNKESQVTFRIKIKQDTKNTTSRCKYLHAPYFYHPVTERFSIFLVIDGKIHDQIFEFDGFLEEKTFYFEYTAASSKKSSDVKLNIISGAYLGNNQEQSILLKYV